MEYAQFYEKPLVAFVTNTIVILLDEIIFFQMAL